MAKSKKTRSNNAGRPSVRAYTLLKQGRLDDLAALAKKSYGIVLDPESGPAAMKVALDTAAKEQAERQAQEAAEREPVAPAAPPPAAGDPPAREVTTESAAEASERARKAEIETLPKDPWVTSGRSPGRPAPVSGVYNEDGVLLLSDTDPVLSDEEWEAELRLSNPDFVVRQDEATQKLLEKMPPEMRPKPHKPPFRHSTNPHIPRAFLNPRTNVYFRPTEKLMRNRDLVPVYSDPPVDAIYGT